MASAYTFDLHREFRFRDIDPGSLWSKLCERDRYGEWWTWMRELETAGAGLEPGASFAFVVVSPLPYRMRLRVTISDSVRPEWLEAKVEGDLRGQARIDLSPEEEDVTLATLAWEVEVMHRAMRIGARAARPLVRWGQDWAVGLALERFAAHMVPEEGADDPPG